MDKIQYCGWPSEWAYKYGFWFRLKVWLFGDHVIEFTRTGLMAEWYAYKGKLYQINYSDFKSRFPFR